MDLDPPLAQTPDAGGGSLPGRLLTRSERSADIGVGQVIAVAQDDRRPLRRRQLVGEVLELGVARAAVGDCRRSDGSGRGATPVLVHRNPRRDRVQPGAQVAPVLQLAVPAEGPQERLLERVLSAVASEPPDEERVQLVAVLEVQRLEGRNAHRLHHLMKRTAAPRCETPSMRVAVVGHVEWVDFVRVERLPAAGEIVHASEAWAEPAGGGAVSAVVLSALADGCLFLTALGDDDVGRRSRDELRRLGVRIEVALRPEPQRRAVTFVDSGGERTITLLSHKLVPRRTDDLPWDELGRADAVYFTGGDADALRAAREARVLVATARELPTLAEAGVELDALVRSAGDPGEAYAAGALDPPPRLVVATEGAAGGVFVAGGSERRYASAPVPAQIRDTY